MIKRRNIPLGFSTEPLMSDNRRGSGEECTDDHGCGFENEKQDDMADGNSHCQNENEKIQGLVDPKIASGLHVILFILFMLLGFTSFCNLWLQFL